MDDGELLECFRIAIYAKGHDKAAHNAAQTICGVSRELDLGVIELIKSVGQKIHPHPPGGCFFGSVFECLETSPYLDESEKTALHAWLSRHYPDTFGISNRVDGVPQLADYKKRRW